MRTLLGILLGLSLISCTTPSGQVNDAPLVSSDATDDEGLQRTLDGFLDARWSFRTEEMLEFVSTADAAVGMPDLASPPFLPADTPLERALIDAWYRYEVGKVVRLRNDEAIATVTVVMPTRASLEQWRSEFGTRLGLFRQVSDEALRRKLVEEEIPKPARRVVGMEYRLRRFADGWRVEMGWPLLHEALEANPDEWTQEFVGSEYWWLEEHRRRAKIATISRDRAGLAPYVDRAEKLAAARQYDAAIAIYDDLALDREVPEFVAERPIALMGQKSRWETIRSRVDVAYTLGAPILEKRWATFPVRATNEGTTAWRFVVAVVVLEEEDGDFDVARLSFGSIGPGESKENELRLFHSGTPPTVRRVELSNVRPADRSRDPEFTLEPDHEFQWRFDDYQTDGAAGRNETRVQSVARQSGDRLALCAGWPSTPIDVTVKIGPNGAVRAVEVPGDDETFAGCVTEAFRRGRYSESPEAWTSVVQIFPPGSGAVKP